MKHKSTLDTVHPKPTELDGAALLDATKGYIEAAKAPATRRAYRTQWKQFSRWCERHTRTSLPAESSTLALYLSDQARRGRKVATLSLALSAIRAAHRDANLPDPADAAEVRTIWAGIRRTHGTAQRRAAPLTAEAIRAISSQLRSGPLRATRDRAMILFGFAGAFRRSELVALDVADVTFKPGRGLVIRVKRSKTDQTGAGAEVAIPFGSDAIQCPVRALQAWLAAGKVTEGPVFRSVDRYSNVGGRLDGRDVARIVKAAAERAGIDATLVSGHSLRSGLATSAALAGKSDRAIMAQGRWRSRAMMDRYVRSEDQWRDNAASGLL